MDSLTYSYPVKRIRLENRTELAYIDEGSGDTTLLFIHGLGSYLPAWQKNIEELRRHYRCIAVDLPNYGKSKRGEYPFTMSFFAETLHFFIRSLRLKKVNLVGHSMGAQIAVTMLLELNQQAEKLVLIAPAGFETFNEAEKHWLRQVYNPALLKAATAEQILQNFNLNFAANQLPADAQFMYEDRMQIRAHHDYYESYCRMIPQCVINMLEEPIFDRLPQLQLPTLVIFGQEDYLIPNRMLHPLDTPALVAQRATAQIPNGKLVLESPGGHFVQWECAASVNTRIKSFVAQE